MSFNARTLSEKRWGLWCRNFKVRTSYSYNINQDYARVHWAVNLQITKVTVFIQNIDSYFFDAVKNNCVWDQVTSIETLSTNFKCYSRKSNGVDEDV